jgi:diadenosine tetraphosphatase ApaH/serine/threonine PP2A family protein phosphatase
MAATKPVKQKPQHEWLRRPAAPLGGHHVARRLNIDGDRQGDLVRHGGEKRRLLYQIDSHQVSTRMVARGVFMIVL